jgi:hypothetical protein
MKTNQTNVIGIIITVILLLITVTFYTINSIVTISKVETPNVVTHLACIDALFYNTLKLFVLLYAIFYASLKLNEVYKFYTNKKEIDADIKSLLERLKKVYNASPVQSSKEKEVIVKERDTFNVTCTTPAFDKLPDITTDCTIEYLIAHYGKDFYKDLSITDECILRFGNTEDKLEILTNVLKKMVSFKNLIKLDTVEEQEKMSSLHNLCCTIERDIKTLKECKK